MIKRKIKYTLYITDNKAVIHTYVHRVHTDIRILEVMEHVIVFLSSMHVLKVIKDSADDVLTDG